MCVCCLCFDVFVGSSVFTFLFSCVFLGETVLDVDDDHSDSGNSTSSQRSKIERGEEEEPDWSERSFLVGC